MENEIKELRDAVESLMAMVRPLVAKQKELDKRIADLENELRDKDSDKRLKNNVIRVMEFTLVKSGEYWHAVKSLNNEQVRIYIGKHADEEKVKKKIVEWLKKTKFNRSNFLEKHPEYERLFIDL